MKLKIIIGVFLIISLLSACESESNSTENNHSIESQETTTNANDETSPKVSEDINKEDIDSSEQAGEGKFLGDTSMLSEEEKAIILEYLDAYYQSLVRLEPVNIDSLYSNSMSVNAELNRAAWEFTTDIRKKQISDLSIKSFQYFLTVSEVEKTDEGLRVALSEDSLVHFAAYPDIEAEQYDVRHRFILDKETDGSKIISHLQSGTLYWELLGDYSRWVRDDMDEIDEEEQRPLDTEIIAYIWSQKKDLLRKADNNLQIRNQVQEKKQDISYDYAYDRQAAVQYANEWINRRNDQWLDYSGLGGNCQNFASQSMLAGGIPMDTQGDHVWKWFGPSVNNTRANRGRTSSWTGVDEFFAYAQLNEGSGLVADTGVEYKEGEIGDILILGFDDNWRHTVLITDIIYDEQGVVIDYLIASNTKDQKNYPVSAYLYTRQQLIKIYGWNE